MTLPKRNRSQNHMELQKYRSLTPVKTRKIRVNVVLACPKMSKHIPHKILINGCWYNVIIVRLNSYINKIAWNSKLRVLVDTPKNRSSKTVISLNQELHFTYDNASEIDIIDGCDNWCYEKFSTSGESIYFENSEKCTCKLIIYYHLNNRICTSFGQVNLTLQHLALHKTITASFYEKNRIKNLVCSCKICLGYSSTCQEGNRCCKYFIRESSHLITISSVKDAIKNCRSYYPDRP